jgi:hypothetical protein
MVVPESASTSGSDVLLKPAIVADGLKPSAANNSSSPNSEIVMKHFIGAAALLAALTIPLAAHAQGVPGGMEQGAREGNRAAGPIGAIVGGTIGGVVGGVAGVLGVEQRPRFRTYVVEQRHPSYQYREEVVVGRALPESGITYYDMPQEYGVRNYRYAVVNGRTVLVDPRTRQIVEIIE